MRYQKGSKRESKFSLEQVLDYIEENNVSRMMDLPKQLMNFVYREKLSDKIPFNSDRVEKRKIKRDLLFQENRLQQWYDIKKIMPYLERWAREEKTTVEHQAIAGFLEPEWEQWCLEHPEYRNK